MNKKIINLLKNNFNRILLISIPVITISSIISSYFIYLKYFKKEKSEEKILPPEKEDEKEDTEIFPEIKSIDFYDLIDFENGSPIIGDRMIAAIIKDIVTRLGTSLGDISFYITEKTNREKLIFFKWINDKKELKKTYIISINAL
ncbi:MAG: hypothetical protein KFW07_00225 [Mycoplasmataceae bacterium]|nr:hypothetical protein [Mycoplasmataceae bacterium]